MSETTKNKYTLETLLPLNVSYDRDHILRQQDVDMVNRLVEVIEGSRSSLTPKVGDRMRHVDRNGDFYGYALLENLKADGMSVCLAPYVPFVGIGDPDIWLSVSGGPFTSIDLAKMRFIGWEDGVWMRLTSARSLYRSVYRVHLRIGLINRLYVCFLLPLFLVLY